MSLAEKNIIDRFEYQSLDSLRFELYRQQSDIVKTSFADDVHAGLISRPKKLLPKYFYDDNGSRLFEKITGTPEYYPTRSEKEILIENVNELREYCSNTDIIAELGSGNSEKTRIILKSFISSGSKISYMPIDVSDILINSSHDLLKLYPDLRVTGIISEYEPGLSLLSEFDETSKLVIFLGSSIGNFERHEANDLLQCVADALGENDYLLVGFDLEKNIDVLRKAYNDAQGYTEAFNINILERINRELDADFNIDEYKHKAFYNSLASRIEMHLVSKKDQQVFIKSLKTSYNFEKGESIHTENSHKFNDDSIQDLAESSGLNIVKTWKDKNNYFALTLFNLR